MPMHKLLLSAAIASLIVAPTAFAHGHRTVRASLHAGSHVRGHLANTSHKHANRDEHSIALVRDDRARGAAASAGRNPGYVDEEELGQDELAMQAN